MFKPPTQAAETAAVWRLDHLWISGVVDYAGRVCAIIESIMGDHLIYLAFGANLGARLATLCAARQRLAPDVRVTRASGVYETPPWGVADQPPFLNAVCQARTALAPLALLHRLKQIERELGRVASVRWGPRAIDLDILLYDDLVLHTPELVIPHPALHERAFVLVPLAEIAPDLIHPVLGQTMVQLAAQSKPADVRWVGTLAAEGIETDML